MATAAEIRNKAAKKLGLYAAGQTLRSEIAADLDAAYLEVYAEIAANKIATWAVTADVPVHMVESMVALVAFARVDEYSVPAEKYQRVTAKGLAAENRMRELTAQSRHGVTKVENF